MTTHEKTNRFVIALISLLGAVESGIALAAASSDLKSPYFIDAIHCEGIDELIDSDQLKKTFISDEVAIVGTRVLRQKQCEAIFQAYHVEKFSWVTPQDLETLEFALKHSQRFEAVDISIAKSELPNHVHLTGKFKLFEKRTHYTVTSRAGLYRGTDGSGDRRTTDFDARVDIGQRGPHNDAPYVVDIGVLDSQAPRPLPVSALKAGTKPITLSPNETVALNRPSSTYGHADLRFNLPTYTTYDAFFQVGIDRSHLSGDAGAASGHRMEVGVVTHDLSPWGFNGRTQISYLQSQYYFLGTDFVSNDPQTPRAKSQDMGFIGLSGVGSSRQFDQDFAVYRSTTKDLHAFGHINLLFRFGEAWGFKHALGLHDDLVIGAVLPEHRFGLPDRNATEVYYDLKKPMLLWGGEHEFDAKIGLASYSSRADSDVSYVRNSGYGELGWKLHTRDIDVGLAFLYGGSRLY